VSAPDPFAESPLTEGTLRPLARRFAWIAAVLLAGMSAWHLGVATRWGELAAMVQRGTHLAFALGLAFFLYPVARGRACRGGWFVLDLGLALLGAACALYVAWHHEAIARRIGNHTTLDLVVAVVGITLLLEATRRAISPALFGVTLAFLAYGLFGARLPGELGFREVGFVPLVNFLFYSDGGVFGIPLAVSSTFVFLFVLFGAVLERSGAGRYLIDLAFAAMGRYRGGPAKAAVVASGMMGTVSGSSIANTVATGSMTVPLMKKAGFKPHVAGAVEVAASTNGQLMPPVMGAAAFIMAEMTEIPYATIVVAALLPALLSYTAIFTMIHLEALRTGIEPGDRSALPPFWRTVGRGLHLNLPILALLVLLLGLPAPLRAWAGEMGLDLGRRTPGTAASYTIWITLGLFLVVSGVGARRAYGLAGPGAPDAPGGGAVAAGGARGRFGPGARFVHFLRRSGQALRDGALNMIGIACACACCGIIVGVVSQTGMASKLVALIAELSGGHLLPALALTALAAILLGVGLPTTATYIILGTLVAPALIELAAGAGMPRTLSLVLAAHLFVFYYGILADDTPPVGLCAYAVSGIAGSDPIRTGLTSFRFDLAAFLLPFVFFFNTELLLQEVSLVQVLWVLPGAVVGMMCFAAALQGHALGPLGVPGRLAMLGVAFLLVKPAPWATGLGALLLALVLAAKGRLRNL